MSASFDDAAFWLPTRILDDPDDVVSPAMNFPSKKKGGNALNGGFGFGFDADASKALFPFEFPYGGEYGCAFGGASSDRSSPVESLVESSETESDEEDYLAGLTRKLARSSLDEEFKLSDNPKGWVASGSPQSTLCAVGSGCGCGGQGSSRGSPNAQTTPAATWDLLHAAAGEVAKMRKNESRGLLGPARKPTNNYPDFAYFLQQQQQQQLSQKHLQAAQFQRLRQHQQMMKEQARYQQQLTRTATHQMVPPRASHTAVNTRPLLGLSPSAWPPLQSAQPKQQKSASGLRAGTGVFIPMAINSSRPEPPGKKQGCPKVYLPARVVQALKLNVDDMVNAQLHQQQRNVNGRFTPDYEVALRLRATNAAATANAALSQPKRNIRPQQAPIGNEIRLPHEWTY